MKIVCPNCSASYTLPDAALGAAGRKVKCATCTKVWHAMPPQSGQPDEKPAPAPARPKAGADTKASAPVAAQPDPRDAASDWDIGGDTDEDPFGDAHDTADLAGDDGALESGPVSGRPLVGEGAPAPAAVRARKPGKVRLKGGRGEPSRLDRLLARARTVAPPAAVALGLGLLVLAIPMRDAVVRVLPDLAPLYELAGLDVNVRGISFSPFVAQRSVVAGLSLLRIEGEMINIDDAIRPVGPLRMALLAQNGAELFVWRVDPPVTDLMPQQRVPVFSELTAPPETVASVAVRFLREDEVLPGQTF